MKGAIVFSLLALGVAVAAGTLRTADIDFLQKQKKIFDLLAYVDQAVLPDSEYFEVGHNYDIFSSMEFYSDKEIVKEFDYRFKLGMLKKDALFTYYKPEHREEMLLLYRLFFSANDFATFYKTACWARIHMNSGMFTTAFTTAVIYRPDTRYIRLPAIYEIYPHMFFDSKVIREAYHVKMTRGNHYRNFNLGMRMPENMNAIETFHVYSNFTDFCVNPTYDFNYEYKLNYFMEDIGLNAYYYYFRMAFPFWMDTKNYNVPKSFRGDFYYFFHQQLMARYYNERLSNGFGELKPFTWDNFELPGYYSDIVYPNGVSMPKRDWWNVVPYYKYRYLEYIKKLEIRIMEAIDSGYFFDESGKQMSLYGPEGLNYLGNMIEGNCDSFNMKYYGAFDALAREILGMSFDCKCKDYYVPSSLQYFSTSLRDPAFYRMYHKILDFFHRYKENLVRYTKTELEFPGIKFENVDMDKLVTYFDYKDFFINNAVAVESFKEGKSFSIKAWQYFLNYKPFSYKFAVNSDKDTKAVVRIFLGPAFDGEKYDDFSYLSHYYKYFYMLDEFSINLKSGMNTFNRNSEQSSFFKGEYFNGDYYYKKMMRGLEGSEPFTYSEEMWGFPAHLMLPKGMPEGMRYKMFFFIGPYEEPKQYEFPIFGKFYYYGKSFGYPLDRPMYPWFFKLGNLYFKDVMIYHMKDYESKFSRQYQ